MIQNIKLPDGSIKIILKYSISFKLSKKDLDLNKLSVIVSNVVNDLGKQVFNDIVSRVFKRIKKLNPYLKFNQVTRLRSFVSDIGDLKILDWEIRTKENNRYIGRFLNLILALEKQKTIIGNVRLKLNYLVSVLTYRQVKDFFKVLFNIKRSHTDWNKLFREQKIRKDFVLFNETALEGDLGKETVQYLIRQADETGLRLCVGKRKRTERSCITVVLEKFKTVKGKTLKRVAFELDMGVGYLMKQVLKKKWTYPKSLNKERDIIAITDGDRFLENTLKEKYSQRCLFHVLKYIRSNWQGEDEKDKRIRDSFIKMMKSVILIPTNKYKESDKRFKGCFKIKRLDELIRIVKQKARQYQELTRWCKRNNQEQIAFHLKEAKDSIFTYVCNFIKYHQEIPRTNNELERIMRDIKKRMKRVGARWSYDGGIKMIAAVLERYYHLKPNFIVDNNLTIKINSS